MKAIKKYLNKKLLKKILIGFVALIAVFYFFSAGSDDPPLYEKESPYEEEEEEERGSSSNKNLMIIITIAVIVFFLKGKRGTIKPPQPFNKDKISPHDHFLDKSSPQKAVGGKWVFVPDKKKKKQSKGSKSGSNKK